MAVNLYRECFKRGSATTPLLLDLFKLLGPEELESRFEVLAKLIDVAGTSEEKDRFKGWFVILSDGLNLNHEQAFVYLMSIELNQSFDGNLINAGYRISTRLDRQDDFRQLLQTQTVEPVEMSPEYGDIYDGLNEIGLEAIGVSLGQLARISSPRDFREWLEQSANLLDIQMVPIIEWFADTRCADHRNLQLWFYEMALELCLAHTDEDILPASWRTHLAMIQVQPKAGDALALKDPKFSEARHTALFCWPCISGQVTHAKHLSLSWLPKRSDLWGERHKSSAASVSFVGSETGAEGFSYR